MPPPSAPRTKPDEAVFLTLVALLPVMQPFTLQFGSYPIPLADFVFLVLCPAFLFMVASGRRPLRIGGWSWAVVAYGLAAALAAFASEDRRTSLIKLAGIASLSGSFEDTRHVWVLMGLLAAVPHLPGEDRG